MDNGTLALFISFTSALFTGGGLIYTRRLAVNDTKKMKRKHPAIEPHFSVRPGHEGWTFIKLNIRNLEPYEIRLTGIFGRPADATFYLDPQTNQHSTKESAARSRAINVRILPQGSAMTSIRLYAKGIQKARDLRIDWEWIDGAKD